MKVLKGFVLGLLGFLLSLSLAIFGLAFMLNSTALNPRFITSQITSLDISSLAEQVISEQTTKGEVPDELVTAMVNTLPELEPMIKDRVSEGIYSIYDYLLGRRPNPDLVLTLRNTLLTKDFFISVIDKVDISPFAKEMLAKQFPGEITPEMEKYLDEFLDKFITENKPWIKEQVNAAADPILDYLSGLSPSFNVVIPLEPLKESLKDTVREAFLKAPELAGIPQAELEQYFDQLYQEISAQIPSTFEINEGLLGTEVKTKIAEELTKAEEQLTLVNRIIGYFQLGYKLLIVFMLLLIAGIILIHRQVKGASRELGIIFLTYGALEYAGVLLAKYFAQTQLPLAEIPASLQTWVLQFFDNLLSPLAMLSLGLLVGGIVLIIVSFVYRVHRA